jgi:hypothetical protein
MRRGKWVPQERNQWNIHSLIDDDQNDDFWCFNDEIDESKCFAWWLLTWKISFWSWLSLSLSISYEQKEDKCLSSTTWHSCL